MAHPKIKGAKHSFAFFFNILSLIIVWTLIQPSLQAQNAIPELDDDIFNTSPTPEPSPAKRTPPASMRRPSSNEAPQPPKTSRTTPKAAKPASTSQPPKQSSERPVAPSKSAASTKKGADEAVAAVKTKKDDSSKENVKTTVKETKDSSLPEPDFSVILDRLRLNRAKIFTPHIGEEDESTANPETWFSCLELEFKATPIKNWAIVSINDIKMLQAKSPQGRQLVGAGDTAMNNLAPMLQTYSGIARMRLRTTPPPSGIYQLNDVQIQFDLVMGYQKKIFVEDIRKKVGESLLRKSTSIDTMELQLDTIVDESISLVAIGDLNRFAFVRFLDSKGNELIPYSSEMMNSGIERKDLAPLRTWTYSFSKLPNRIDMELVVYPTLHMKTKTVRINELPLP